jgi:hypothetical protein
MARGLLWPALPEALTHASRPQDLMAMSAAYCTRPAREEVINDPTNPKHYWRFRCVWCGALAALAGKGWHPSQPHTNDHLLALRRLAPTLEELLADRELTALLQDMLLAGGRCSESELPPAC